MNNIDELAGRILDEETEQTDEMLQEEIAALDQPSKQHFARLQFLHALLGRLYRSDTAETDRRVQRVMNALDGQPAEETLPRAAKPTVVPYPTGARRPHMIPLIAAAAAMLLVSIVWFSVGENNTAYAAVQRALDNALADVDREYRVRAELQGPLEIRRDVEATLYVRGAEKFAVRHPGLLRKREIWAGSNGQQGWLVPPIGPVLVNEDQDLIKKWLQEKVVSTPFLQITSILERMADKYDLEKLPAEKLPDLEGTDADIKWQRIRGTTKDRKTDGPKTIELWSHPRTGAAQRLILDWQGTPGKANVNQITLDLIGQPKLADDWYEHSGHHQGRMVIQKGSGW